MRSPTDPNVQRPASPRRRFFLAAFLAVVIVAVLSLRSLATLWTDQLWFGSLHISNVFSTLLEVKVGLAAAFGAAFFVVLWINLFLTDRLGARDLSFEPEDEIVRRFQDVVRPYAGRIYAALALVFGAVAGIAATSQWQNYLLFANARSFHQKDLLFHKDLGFYIFTLPFLSFIVNWCLAALVAILVISAVFHYLNGGIRATRESSRVTPAVKVHLSIILAGLAILKAVGYVIAKWDLVTSQNGYVEGAGYADVHARIPALTILCFLSLAAAVILLFNIRMRGWSLPAIAVGLWAFVAIAIGVIYPAALQTFKVTPAQSTEELPYVQRNIEATRQAYGLDAVSTHNYTAVTSITPALVHESEPTLKNIRLWDPNPSIALETVNRRQSIRPYYQFSSLAVDRYLVNGVETPVLIGARITNPEGISTPSWVKNHLEYTHGSGAVVLPANESDPSTGNPIFAVGNVPPTSSDGLPALMQPNIYFGPGMTGWVVADTKQKELDYQVNSGANAGNPVESHYEGVGGVQSGSLLRRAAFALRFGDLNMFISDQITSKSRVMWVRDPSAMAAKAAPFLSWDAHPYAVIADGHVQYVLNGYTTTDNYPYSQDASTATVPADTGLPGAYNYVRNSVICVVDAYNGSASFYASDPSDPILQAYRAAFPSMFKPMSDMPSAVRTHLRYPQDLFSIQAAMLGRYHITTPSSFYNAADSWEISPTAGAGSPNQSLAYTTVTNSQGEVVSQGLSPMDPEYQVMALPGQTNQQLLLSAAFVPAGNSSTVQGLSAFIIASSDPSDYGRLNVYITPRGTSVIGPAQADSEIQQNQLVSSTITPLDQHGSHVILGNNLMIPLKNSILYVRPLYVTSTNNPLPQLKYVITVFNQNVGIEPTLAAALKDALGSTVSGGGGTTPTPPSHGTAASYLAQAVAAYNNAQAALKAGNLGQYQADVTLMNEYLKQAQSALASNKNVG